MGQSAPRVSILLPNLNHRPFLEERLKSIQDQTFNDWELIIVDNYSDDGAWEFFESLPKRDPRIRIFQAPRNGMYDNWNNCIRLAKGEYVYIATSDDTMAPDFLVRMVRALDENPDCDLAHCKLRIIDEKGEPCTTFIWDRFFCVKFFQDWIDRTHIRRAPFDGILHCGVRTVYTSITQLLIRRRLFDRVGLFSTRFGSAADFEWGMRASLLTHTVHVPRYLAAWRVHGRQGTDLKQLDTARQKRKLIQMVRHAFRAARRIDPAALRMLRLSDLTYLYRKERLYAVIKEKQQRLAPKPLSWFHKIGIGLVCLSRDPLIFLKFYRQRKNARQFLNPLSPMRYPRELLEKYGLTEHLVPSRFAPPAGCKVGTTESAEIAPNFKGERESMSNKKLWTYFGHHKCGTTWIHSILTEVCLKLMLKIEYVHSAKQFEGNIEIFIEKNGIDFLTYANADIDFVSKLKSFTGFHVIRDPRDIIVSSYFSHLHSHPVDDWAALATHRGKLQKATKEEGIFLDIEFMEQELKRLDSWNYLLPGVKEVKMEELIGDPRTKFIEIFNYLGIIDENSSDPMPDKISLPMLDGILKQKSFSVLSKGRKPGKENVSSHFRKGIAGDWLNHFSEAHKKYFKEKYNHLLIKLGYEKDDKW